MQQYKDHPILMWLARLNFVFHFVFQWWVCLHLFDSEFMTGRPNELDDCTPDNNAERRPNGEGYGYAEENYACHFEGETAESYLPRIAFIIVVGLSSMFAFDQGCRSCEEGSTNPFLGVVDWVLWMIWLPMLCTDRCLRPNQEPERRNYPIVVPYIQSAAIDFFGAPVVVHALVVSGRFNFSEPRDEEDSSMTNYILLGLLSTWIHWATFALLDPWATFFGRESNNTKADWPLLVFVTRLFEVISRTLFLGCFSSAFGMWLAFLWVVADWFVLVCFMGRENDDPFCLVWSIFCYTASMRDAGFPSSKGSKNPGGSNFWSRDYAFFSTFRLLQLGFLLLMWSTDSLHYEIDTCETANDGVCDEA